MSLHTARLNKIVKIAYADEKLSRKDIYDDVSKFIRKEDNPKPATKGGGDYHSVLWAVFKDCIFEQDVENFDESVADLIEGNSRRKRLYPELATGLKSWGLMKRRWMNEEIKRIKSPTGLIELDDLDVSFKVNNILALEIIGKGNRYIYPYFSEEPELTPGAARIALWGMHLALPSLPAHELRVLDVMRGRSFSTADVPFLGDEQAVLVGHVTNILQRWNKRYQERRKSAA